MLKDIFCLIFYIAGVNPAQSNCFTGKTVDCHLCVILLWFIDGSMQWICKFLYVLYINVKY